MSMNCGATVCNDFPVRDGTINFGTLYESVTAAILSVHHCRQDGMWLARNLGSIGNFDDIILKSDPFTYLIQAKYNNKNKIITTNNFTEYEEREQFCLENCLGDYWKLKRKIDNISQNNDIYKNLHDEEDNLKYILHTNRKVARCDFLEVTNSEFYYKNKLNCGTLYKFKPEALLKYPNLKKKIRIEFFNNLYLYSEEVLFRNTDDAVMLGTELKELLTEAGCRRLDKQMLEDSAVFYKRFFQQWEMCLLSDKPTHNFRLFREHVIAKVTEILLNRFSFKFEDINIINPQKLPTNCDWRAIEQTDITITDCDKRIYPLLKKYIIKRVDPNYTFNTASERCKIYHRTGNSSHSRWCMWVHKLLPLVLEIKEHKDFSDIIKIMQLSKCNLSILIINNTKKDWPFLEKTIGNCTGSIRYLPSPQLLIGNVSSAESQHAINHTSNGLPSTSQVDNIVDELAVRFTSSMNIRGNVDLLQAVKNKNISSDDVTDSDKFGKTALHYAAWTKSSQMITKLAKMGADVDAQDICGKTPLHYAVDVDNMECVICLLDEGATVDRVDQENTTPLLYSVKNGQLDIVEMLLSKDACTDIADTLGRSPLSVAVSRTNRDLVSLLLTKNANTELQYEGNTALHCAVLKGCVEIVTLLLENGAKVNAPNAAGKTALYLAVDCNYSGVVSLLLNKHANIELKYEGNTMLHRAVARGFKEIASLLLENGLDVNQIDSLGKTALYLAVNRNDADMVFLLLQREANTELKYKGSSVLHCAVTKRFIEIVTLLLENGANVDERDFEERTPLWLAVDCSNVEAVALLLTKNANIELKRDGNTVLHHAVIRGSLEIVRLLLEKGAKINAQNNHRRTALHLACDSLPKWKSSRKIDYASEVDHAEIFKAIVALLLNKGAKIKILDRSHKTAFFYAENMLANIGKYLDQNSMDNTDEDTDSYLLLRPCIIDHYKAIVTMIENKLLELEESSSTSG